VSGALRGMVQGEVSEEWMKQHHNLWYEHLKGGAQEQQGESRAPRSRPGPEPLH
jgi:cytochrome b subunit of formate dehydrogenase